MQYEDSIPTCFIHKLTPLVTVTEKDVDYQICPQCHGVQSPLAKESDGSTASYYELPEGATELQHLIAYKNMNAQMGEIFRACYRYGQVKHSPKIRDIKKIIYYANEELKRLEKYETSEQTD